jgi:hypothetical protein
MAWVILDMTPVLFQAIMLAEHWNQEVNSLIMTKKSFFVLQREKKERKTDQHLMLSYLSPVQNAATHKQVDPTGVDAALETSQLHCRSLPTFASPIIAHERALRFKPRSFKNSHRSGAS